MKIVLDRPVADVAEMAADLLAEFLPCNLSKNDREVIIRVIDELRYIRDHTCRVCDSLGEVACHNAGCGAIEEVDTRPLFD